MDIGIFNTVKLNIKNNFKKVKILCKKFVRIDIDKSSELKVSGY